MAIVHRVERVEPVHDHHYYYEGRGFVLGVIVLLIVAFLLLYYLLPVLRSIPQASQINIPSQININLRQQK